MGVLCYRIAIMGEKPSAEMQRIVYLVVRHSGQVLSASCHCSDYDVHISPGCINWKTSWDLWALTNRPQRTSARTILTGKSWPQSCCGQYFHIKNGSQDRLYMGEVARSDKLTENYEPALQFMQLFSSLFWFSTPLISCFGSLSPLSSASSPGARPQKNIHY